jgi:hypothetical protein
MIAQVSPAGNDSPAETITSCIVHHLAGGLGCSPRRSG